MKLLSVIGAKRGRSTMRQTAGLMTDNDCYKLILHGTAKNPESILIIPNRRKNEFLPDLILSNGSISIRFAESTWRLALENDHNLLYMSNAARDATIAAEDLTNYLTRYMG